MTFIKIYFPTRHFTKLLDFQSVFLPKLWAASSSLCDTWHVTHATVFFWMKLRIYCLGKTQLFGTLRKIILFRHVIHTSRWTHLSLLQISMYTQSRHTGLKNLRLRGIPNDISAGKMFAEQHQPSHNCIHISEETIIDELLRCCAASLSSSDRNTYFSSIFDTNFSGIILEIQKTGQG